MACGKPLTPAKGQKPTTTHHCTKEAGNRLTNLIIKEAKPPQKQRAQTDRSAT